MQLLSFFFLFFFVILAREASQIPGPFPNTKDCWLRQKEEKDGKERRMNKRRRKKHVDVTVVHAVRARCFTVVTAEPHLSGWEDLVPRFLRAYRMFSDGPSVSVFASARPRRILLQFGKFCLFFCLRPSQPFGCKKASHALPSLRPIEPQLCGPGDLERWLVDQEILTWSFLSGSSFFSLPGCRRGAQRQHTQCV